MAAGPGILEALHRKPFAVVGHRGARGLAPENTLAALEAAVEAGADAAEFDVQMTRDGVLVASHDPVVETDEGTLDVRGSTWERVSRARVSGERIPRVEELLEAAERHGIPLLLEVKEPGDAPHLARLLVERGAERRAAVISFHEEAVRSVKNVSRLIPGGLIYFKPPGMITQCKRLGCEIVLPRYPLATPRAVAFAHRLRLTVVAWTVNDEARARRLVEAGVDAIATDRPDLLAGLRDRLQA